MGAAHKQYTPHRLAASGHHLLCAHQLSMRGPNNAASQFTPSVLKGHSALPARSLARSLMLIDPNNAHFTSNPVAPPTRLIVPHLDWASCFKGSKRLRYQGHLLESNLALIGSSDRAGLTSLMDLHLSPLAMAAVGGCCVRVCLVGGLAVTCQLCASAAEAGWM